VCGKRKQQPNTKRKMDKNKKNRERNRVKAKSKQKRENVRIKKTEKPMARKFRVSGPAASRGSKKCAAGREEKIIGEMIDR